MEGVGAVWTLLMRGLVRLLAALGLYEHCLGCEACFVLEAAADPVFAAMMEGPRK